jgi:hypothetical protein
MQLQEVDLTDTSHYRIIPSVFPPINFFEALVDADEMETLWEIENLTNDRVREEIGDLLLVSPEDRVSGPGASVVMAAFTHVGRPSRFTDGTFGIYYASLEKDTAICETSYHREIFLKSTNEDACEVTMRMYQAKINKPLFDLRDKRYAQYHHPDEYSVSQKLGDEYKRKNAWGLVYNSVRKSTGQCVALLRPPATTIPVQVEHMRYVWNGEKISSVFNVSDGIS